MKKLISLNQEYAETKNKIELEAARQKIFAQSVKIFKEQMGELWSSKVFKILKELPTDRVLIEYPEEVDEKMWEAFRSSAIVSIVDSIIPTDI